MGIHDGLAAVRTACKRALLNFTGATVAPDAAHPYNCAHSSVRRPQSPSERTPEPS